MLNRRRIFASIMVSLLALVSVVLARMAITDESDRIRFEHRSQQTGINFGDWPDFFYVGAGGDGEVFAVLAVDPFARGPSQSVRAPVLRYSRIGFSSSAWIVSLGNEAYALPGLVVIGLGSVATLGFIARYQNDILGWRSWFFIANPAVFVGFLGDTAEPLAVALLALTLLTGSSWLAAALGTVRPTYSVALSGRWRPFLIALGTAAAVLVLASYIFPTQAIDGFVGTVTWPFLGYLEHPSPFAGTILLAAFFTLGTGIIRKDLGWVVAGVSVVCLGPLVLEFPLNGLRAAGMLPVLWALGPRYQYLRPKISPTNSRRSC